MECIFVKYDQQQSTIASIKFISSNKFKSTVWQLISEAVVSADLLGLWLH